MKHMAIKENMVFYWCEWK